MDKMDKDSQSSFHCSFPADATTSDNQMGFSPAGADSGRTNFFPAARPCDYCNAADAVIFCHADSAFTCMACDAMLHRPGTACHGRVWVCEVCEQAPAVINCKADAAALCAACDRDIHSANPLASRHDRTQVLPFYDSAGAAVMKSDSDTLLIDRATACDDVFGERCFAGAGQVPVGNLDAKSLDFFFSDTDQVLDYQIYSDSLVPMQTIQKPPLTAEVTHRQPPEYRFECDLSRSHVTTYSNSVSSSSMDAGLVPNDISLSEVSYPFPRKLGPSHVGMDREARVLRYKEKRKNRNFEKTIRYASRKAYAEARPRIKGRFVKRPTESETESDGTFSLGGHGFYNDLDALFGVVPSS